MRRWARGRVAVAAVGAWLVQPAWAQAAVDFDPAYVRYDSVDPQLPGDYPARRYTPEALVARLVEMANGPLPSVEALEHEFGLRFVKLVDNDVYLIARGRHPLGNALSRYTTNVDRGAVSVSILLDFRDRVVQAEGTLRPWSDPRFCISAAAFEGALGPGWVREVREIGHLPRRVVYRKVLAGTERRLEIGPDKPGQFQCTHTYSLSHAAAAGKSAGGQVPVGAARGGRGGNQEQASGPEMALDRKLTTPADDRYDAAGVVLPDTYPASSDDPQTLIARLVRWGSVPAPRRSDVEEEFGLRFVDGFARGRPPLGDWLSSASGPDALSALLLSFQNRPTLAEAARLAPLRRHVCVDASALARAFEAAGWTLRIRQGGPHGGEELRFTKPVGPGIRQVSFAPLDQGFRSGAAGNCLDVIQYAFD